MEKKKMNYLGIILINILLKEMGYLRIILANNYAKNILV